MTTATNVVEGLRLAEGVLLPIDYVTKTTAILAQRRKGKTYTANVLAEELVHARLPWVALDPTGAWWGLRSSADGEHPGLPVVVLGGQHADLPLERHGGAAIADLVLDHPGWYVLDLSLLDSRAAERDFSLAFAQRLYRRKMQPGMDFPLHLFVDEADLFVPQERETSQDNLVLGAFQAIVRRGGLHGLGVTLISQRPALVNKSALTQLDLLVLLRLIAGQDQDAVYKGYVKRFGTKQQQDGLMAGLATLRVGEAFLLEPGADPPLFARVQVRERETFNSSATPKAGEQRVEPSVFAEVDLDAIAAQMSEAVERALENDPGELRRRLATEHAKRVEAESELHDLAAWASEVEQADDGPTAIDALVATYQIAKSRVGYSCDLIDEARALAAGGGAPAVSDEQVEALRETSAEIAAVSDELARVVARLFALPVEILGPVPGPRDPEQPVAPVLVPARPVPPPIPPPPVIPPARLAQTNGTLSTGAQHLLSTLGTHYPLRLTTGQLALLANRKARGGAWNSAMKILREGGYIVEQDGTVSLTPEGVEASGASAVSLDGPSTRARWRNALPTTARDIYDVLVERYPAEVEVAQVAELVGRKPTGGSWNSAVATLTRNGLAAKVGTKLSATIEGYGG